MTSVDHNVITNATGILTVSSKMKNKSKPSVVVNQPDVLELELDYDITMLGEIESAEPYEQHMCAYIALCVEDKYIQNTKQHKNKCTECANILLASNDKINDELLAMKDGQIQPSASTLKIVIFCNAVMKLYSANHNGGNSFNAILNTVFKNINIDDLYDESDFSHHEQNVSVLINHKPEFIKELIKTHMILKSHKIGRKITDEDKGELIRYNKKRDYILAGQ